MKLNVNEWFGPTIQGEGPQAGQLATFLRLAGCNLSCSWCDTPYSWDWDNYDRSTEVTTYDLQDLAALIEPTQGRLILTGGEPALQATALREFIPMLSRRPIDLETNGTVSIAKIGHYLDSVSCSPKIIPSAGQDPRVTAQLHPSVLLHLRTVFKFVVADDQDLAAVVDWVDSNQVTRNKVWLMPEGTDAETLTERTPWLIEQAVQHGYNYSTRLHVYGWSDVRGH